MQHGDGEFGARLGIHQQVTVVGGNVRDEDRLTESCGSSHNALAGSDAKLSLDAPPFSLVAGDHARLAGLNTVGLKRRGFSPEKRRALKRAFRLLFSSKLRLEVALARVREELADSDEVARLVRFVEKSERGVCR